MTSMPEFLKCEFKMIQLKRPVWLPWKYRKTLRAGPSLMRVRQLPKDPKILEKNRVAEEFQMNYKNNLAHPFNQKNKNFGKSY